MTSASSQQPILSSNESNDDQSNQYIFTRLLQKIQRFVIQNPTTATTFYTSFNEIFTSEIEKINISQSSKSKITPTIKNPLIVCGRGRPSNKRIPSTIKLSNNKKQKINKNTKENRSESQKSTASSIIHINPLREIQNFNTTTIHSQDSSSSDQYFIEADFLSNELDLGKLLETNQNESEQCHYCGETLLNPLLLKVLEYLNDIATGKNFIELPNRITNFKHELLKIIKGIRYSEYRVDAIKRIQEIGCQKPIPGYYGSKGLAVSLKTLTKIFVETKILTTNLCALQSFSQYMTQVLVPEIAIRLIAEDYNNSSLEAANKIMINSVEFGQYVYDDSD
ncbi:21732_t:CDS:2 [Gigaspora margarita]|uniref:Restriction of telomere capping protein 4 n=1 Tax=Gigaspora margarita TaxID=4874 RepID=A0ABN7UV68_GIGMA|nr:21732_t:CDS:2 [Gigaspora margarita]